LSAILDSLIKAGHQIPRTCYERLLEAFALPLNRITDQIINRELVELVRDLKPVPRDLADEYNMFKEKWNKLLGDVQELFSGPPNQSWKFEPRS